MNNVIDEILRFISGQRTSFSMNTLSSRSEGIDAELLVIGFLVWLIISIVLMIKKLTNGKSAE